MRGVDLLVSVCLAVAGCDQVLGLHGLTQPKWTAVATGFFHTCAVRGDGTLWCWGENVWGECGVDGSNEVDTPKQVGSAHWLTVAAGLEYTCGIQDDQSLWCWGNNGSDQLGIPLTGFAGDTTVPVPTEVGGQWQTVAMAVSHTCGIQADGSLWCWGYNSHGEVGQPLVGGFFPTPQPVTGAGIPSQWKSVCAGASPPWEHSCAVDASGGLWCWGDDYWGELGTGPNGSSSTTPVQVGTDTTWSDVACGGATSCGLRNGSADVPEWDCWGAGFTSTPVAQMSGAWVAVRSGIADSCAIDDAGELWCFGDNQHQQLGSNVQPGSNGNTTSTGTPVQLTSGGGVWRDVAIGGGHLCALGSDTSLWCAGSDGYGQLGDGGGSPRAPLQVGSGSSWTSVAAGNAQMCAVDAQGNVACAGDDANDALGSADGNLHASFVAVPLTGSASAIAVGDYLGCAVTAGNLVCWGYNISGGVGVLPTVNGGDLPMQVTGAGWGQISIEDHGCGLQGSALWCWGNNGGDQAGQDQTTIGAISPPMQTGIGTPWTAVTSGLAHTCMLTAGQAQCFGQNFHGQLGAGSLANPAYFLPQTVVGGNTFTSIAAGAYHTCAIASDQTAWCWGFADAGQLGYGGLSDQSVPTAVVGALTWNQLAAGWSHTCGLTTGGALWCWGDNSRGALGDGTHDYHTTPVRVGSDTDWKTVAGGNEFTCAIKAAGSLWCWGANDSGQLAYAKAFSTSFVQVQLP